MGEPHKATEEERKTQVWPPAPRRLPRVQTAWPPKRRLWSAWQFCLCFLGVVVGFILCCLSLLVWPFVPKTTDALDVIIAVVFVVIITAAWAVGRRSFEVGLGIALTLVLLALFGVAGTLLLRLGNG